jgi:hypothetical protein
MVSSSKISCPTLQLKLRLAVVGVQWFCRGHLARRKAQHLKETIEDSQTLK